MTADKLKVNARFKLDTDGKPTFETAGGKRHYHIELFTEPDATPVKAVTYVLDPSYYDWKREVEDASDNFREDITSYGDYNITVQARGPAGIIVAKSPLSELLKKSHSTAENPYIAQALKDIDEN